VYFPEALVRHEVARKLALSFEPERLQRDLAKMKDSWWSRHLGPYHDGGWESIALWSPGGSIYEQTSRGSAFGPTEALRGCDYMPWLLTQFPCEKSRVRFMRLKPGGHIFRHSDPIESISDDLVRLHVPVTTNERVRFVINETLLTMKPGELWTVDVRFPYEVTNDGDTSRVHLVVDVLRNAAMDELLTESHSIGSAYLTGYFIRQSVPGRLAHAFSRAR